jgi:NACHT domain
MFKEYLIAKSFDLLFAAAKDSAARLLGESRSTLLTNREDLESSLDLHLRFVKNWSGAVSFSDLKKARRISEIFIDLDLYVYPRRMRIKTDERIQSIPLKDIFEESENHFVLLGQPGAGKTTSMKHICQLLLRDQDFQADRISFPLLIKFRDLNSVRPSNVDQMLLTDQIFKILGLRVEYPPQPKKASRGKSKLLVEERREFEDDINLRASVRRKLVLNFLEEFKILLILDGFDELALDNRRADVVREIGAFATHLDRCTMVVTSRTGDFRYNIENTDHYELCPLNREQVALFARKWLKNDDEASDFLTKIYKTPFADTAIRPLNLAHLCAIYERIKDVPEKPKTVYKKVINLLLEEWDQQRAIKRESRYANFEVDRKYEFLCHLAFVLTRSLAGTVFSSRDLRRVYHEIREEFGLKDSEATQVISEIETHNGLFLQTGYEQFEFAHKSLQEFLTAEYLVKLPTIPDDWRVLRNLANELAIAVAISSSPTDYFHQLVLTRFQKRDLENSFVRAFLSRMILEKPDFKKSIWLDLALLILYSRYIEANAADGDGVLLFFDQDTAANELEGLMRLLSSGATEGILRCYQPELFSRTEDQNDLYRLVRTSGMHASHLKSLSSSLPRILFVRKALLTRFLEVG